jgi:mono/diheme cytochrome c family protein
MVVFALAMALYAWNPPTASGSAAVDAAALFKSKCASCHGVDGKGETPAGKKMGVKDLRSFNGDVEGIIAKGKGKMPAYEKSLGAEKVKALADYVKNTFK